MPQTKGKKTIWQRLNPYQWLELYRGRKIMKKLLLQAAESGFAKTDDRGRKWCRLYSAVETGPLVRVYQNSNPELWKLKSAQQALQESLEEQGVLVLFIDASEIKFSGEIPSRHSFEQEYLWHSDVYRSIAKFSWHSFSAVFEHMHEGAKLLEESELIPEGSSLSLLYFWYNEEEIPIAPRS